MLKFHFISADNLQTIYIFWRKWGFKNCYCLTYSPNLSYSVLDPNPHWIRIRWAPGSGSELRIRIRIQKEENQPKKKKR
jgi:hypothetical protein